MKNTFSIVRLFALLVGAIAASWSTARAEEPAKSAKTLPFLIGGFSDGIYASRLNLADGSMEKPSRLAEVYHPSFFCLHPKLDIVYSVTETMQKDAEHPATITAFKLDRQKMTLTKLNAQPVSGDIPCYVSTDADGKFALIANYTSGSVAVYPIADSGELKPASDVVQHKKGTGPNASRQDGPHAHSILMDPSGRWVVAADLGLDQVLVYELDRAQGKLKPAPTPFFTLPPGSGPRHVTFHPNGKLAFVINELASTLTSAKWDSDKGVFTTVQTASTVMGTVPEGNTTAEVLVHPNGKFVYGSNRGHDSIAIFSVDEKSAAIQLLGNCSTGGKTPRNFRIDPTGGYLLAENQSTHTIRALKIDSATGLLSDSGQSIEQQAPACIKFIGR
jgi:6-phosphogluconolactonase